MRPCRHLIHGCITDHSISVTDKQEIESILFILHSMLTHVSNYELFLPISEHLNLGQVFQLFGGGLGVQEIITLLLINLHVADSHFVVGISR